MQEIQLENLINILHELIVEEEEEDEDKEEVSLFDEISSVELTETVLLLMDDYLLDNGTFITEPNFHDDFKEYIYELVSIPFENEFFWNPNWKEELDLILKDIFEIFFTTIIPYRSYPTSIILNTPNYSFVEAQIQYLRSKPQPEQRTEEWYKFRNNLITASNAYKAFENENTQNQLIYEKCNIISNSNNPSFVNVNTTLHWGQKYEKVSVMIYEEKYKTKIEDFGCIQHDKYSFIGASPDGINVLKDSPRYGRMLEIKNIINREIDGIPKKEYWIQMQLQMEVCNLDECDFLETKFVEYETYQDYIKDIEEDNLKGMIMYFAKPDGSPFYVYKPLTMLDSAAWEEENHLKYSKLQMIWIKNCYWKLEKISCVLVLRNKQWFHQNCPGLQSIWSIIEKERISGFEHRCPTKRIKKDILEINELNGCLLSLNKEDNTISIYNNTDSNRHKIQELELNMDSKIWN